MGRSVRRRRPTAALTVFTAAVAVTAWGGLGAAAGAAPAKQPAQPAPAAPASVPGPLASGCSTYPGGQEICSGTLPSFDGAPLDFDVTKPADGRPGKHPLIVMLHGFGNDKHEWESVNDTGDDGDKYHWNSHWFAEHGYYVLAYTARGFGGDKSIPGYSPNTPNSAVCPGKGGSDCPAQAGTIRVKNKNVEIRDTQWLSANVARAFPGVDTQHVAVTGGSYGGGESWLQAAEPNWTFPNSRDKKLPVLKLQVAVPKYPWTDLAASLAPNGRVPGAPSGGDVYTQSYGLPTDQDGNGTPFGVGKASYTAALQALGATTGDFGTVEPSPQNQGPDPETDPPNEPFYAWQARIAAGEPYSTGPGTDETVIHQIRQAFSHWHSAYYSPGWKAQQTAGQRTAVFSVSGWTDDLFPAVESFRMFHYLKGLDPQWPVTVRAADIGHSRAQNKPGTWHLINHEANAFLQSQIGGAHRATTDVASQVTDCSPSTQPATDEVTAPAPEQFGTGTLTMTSARTATLAPTSGAGDPDSAKTDAIAGGQLPQQSTTRGGCTVGTTPAVPDPAFGFRSVSTPLLQTQTTVGIGYVDATYTATPGSGAVAARVWDVGPDGTPVLISRGVYRYDSVYGDPLTGTLRVPFYGNHYAIAAGHQLRLDLQQQDTPTYRAPTGGSTLALSDIRMVLPTRSTGDTQLVGS